VNHCPTAETASAGQAGCPPCKVCWLGSTHDELGWLYRKMLGSNTGGATPLDVQLVAGDDPWLELRHLAQQGIGRVVVACVNRWDYPWNQYQQFLREFPEVPTALAMSDWWLGARRTGIGHQRQLPHICLSWFRWWDGWVHWLHSTSSSMFGPFPNSIAFDRSLNQRHCVQLAILLVARGEEAASSWRIALSGQCRLETSLGSDFHQTLEDRQAGETFPELILWDDSRLPTCHGPEASLKLACEELVHLQELFPQSRLLVAWTLPRWNVIERLSGVGVQFELLAKPFLGSFSSAALLRM
jgi:hypothetical protein